MAGLGQPLAGAVTAFLGGAVATFELRYAYGLSLLSALATFGIIVATVEPTTREREAAPAGGFFLQLRQCVAYLKNLRLRWLFGFAVLMTVLNHVPYEFYQPYLGVLGSELDFPAKGAPLAAGGHMAVTMLLGSWFASRSVRIRDRLGLGKAQRRARRRGSLVQGIQHHRHNHTCGQTRDRYKRLIAVCYVGQLNINEQMVADGWALAYRRYSTDYVRAETLAKSRREGMWRTEFVPPWKWRKR